MLRFQLTALGLSLALLMGCKPSAQTATSPASPPAVPSPTSPPVPPPPPPPPPPVSPPAVSKGDHVPAPLVSQGATRSPIKGTEATIELFADLKEIQPRVYRTEDGILLQCSLHPFAPERLLSTLVRQIKVDAANPPAPFVRDNLIGFLARGERVSATGEKLQVILLIAKEQQGSLVVVGETPSDVAVERAAAVEATVTSVRWNTVGREKLSYRLSEEQPFELTRLSSKGEAMVFAESKGDPLTRAEFTIDVVAQPRAGRTPAELFDLIIGGAIGALRGARVEQGEKTEFTADGAPGWETTLLVRDPENDRPKMRYLAAIFPRDDGIYRIDAVADETSRPTNAPLFAKMARSFRLTDFTEVTAVDGEALVPLEAGTYSFKFMTGGQSHQLLACALTMRGNRISLRSGNIEPLTGKRTGNDIEMSLDSADNLIKLSGKVVRPNVIEGTMENQAPGGPLQSGTFRIAPVADFLDDQE